MTDTDDSPRRPTIATRLEWDADWLENAHGIHPDDIADNLVPLLREAAAALRTSEDDDG